LIFSATLALLLLSGPASAHDINIAKTRFTALPDQTYELAVQASPTQTHLYPPPHLPKDCAFTGTVPGIQRGAWRSFAFSCTRALTHRDVLRLPWLREGIMLSAQWLTEQTPQQLIMADKNLITLELGRLQAGSGGWWSAAQRYGALGVEHILLGIDHLLFLLGLLLLVKGWRMLVKTITAFTVAHSITLALATLGVVHVPSRPVEATIALSIVIVAIEVIETARGRPGLSAKNPWAVTFLFGLLHGLGFAGALSDIGLPAGEVPAALLFFNVGVELGQLAFVAVALALGWAIARRLGPQRLHLARLAGAYTLGIIATQWFVERAAAILRALS
jgi:hydrogenase/urease accessory protein HupE